MPLTKFKCPKEVKTKGRANEFDYCVNGCIHRCMPRIILHQMVKKLISDRKDRPPITVTTLAAPRATYLAWKYDYSVEPQELYDITRGQFRHAALEVEEGELEGWESEKRYYRKIEVDGEEIEISGQIDGINRESGHTEIIDFKTTKDNNVYFLRDLKDEYVMQINSYRWLIDDVVDKLTIVTLTMGDCIESGRPFTIERFETREPCKLGHKNLIKKECTKVYGKDKQGNPRNGVWATTFMCPPIPILSDEEVEAYIFPRAKVLHDAYSKDIVPPTEFCPMWKCEKYCSVSDICRKLSAKGK